MRSETSNWSRSLVNRYHCTSSLSPWVSLRLCRHCPPPTYPGSASGSPVERNLRINSPELRSSPGILYSSNGLWETCWQACSGWTADLTIIYCSSFRDGIRITDWACVREPVACFFLASRQKINQGFANFGSSGWQSYVYLCDNFLYI